MTRAAANPPPATPAAGRARAVRARVAAVHRQGRQWRIVIAKVDGPSVEVVAASSFADSDSAPLAALLREHRVEHAIHTLPSSRTVCRTAQLPETPADRDGTQLAGALALLAEADLPSSIPAHRRAGGLIVPGPAARPIPLLVGWPVAAANAADDLLDLDADEESYIPEPIALAALAAAPAPAGPGGAETAMYADPATGSIAVLSATADRSIARILRADNSSAAAWSAAVAAALKETRAAVGLNSDLTAAARPSTETPSLLLVGAGAPDASAVRITGIGTDAAWRATYGIPLGAILAWASPDPLAAPLSALRRDPPGRGGSPVIRTVTWLSQPRRAAIAIGLCFAALLLWPLAVAAARTWVLQQRAGSTAELNQRLDAADRQVAFYELLRAKRWPMTKLLADIASSAPVGIRLDQVDLNPEGGASAVSIRGSADSRELIAAFSRNLADHNVFAGVRTPLITEGSGGGAEGVAFTLEAGVPGPLIKKPPTDDFAKDPLAVRLYGEDARGRTLPPLASHAGAPTPSPRDRADRTDRDADRDRDRDRSPRRTTRSNDAGGASTASPPPPPARGEIPPILTEDEIAALDRTAALAAFRARIAVVNREGLDEMTRQRLRDEMEQIRPRMIILTAPREGAPK